MRVTLDKLAQKDFIQGLQKDLSIILAEAVNDNNWQEVLKLLSSKVKLNVNVVNKNGETPLHWAIWHGQKETVEKLIEKGADVNKETKCGETPLNFAARHEQKEIVKLLLNKLGLSDVVEID